MFFDWLMLIITKLLQLRIKMVPKSDVYVVFVSNGAKHKYTHLPEFRMLLAGPSSVDPRSLEKLSPSEIANTESKCTMWVNTADLLSLHLF